MSSEGDAMSASLGNGSSTTMTSMSLAMDAEGESAEEHEGARGMVERVITMLTGFDSGTEGQLANWKLSSIAHCNGEVY
jgi:hypothetical protein